MKRLILLFVMTSYLMSFSLSQKAQTFEFKLYDCQSHEMVQIKGDTLFFISKSYGENIDYEIRLKENDLAQVLENFSAICQNMENEIWLNHCIDDGTNLKLYISKNGKKKKVFVGNYYNAHLNKIALIINSYLVEVDNKISYGTEKEGDIKNQIESQRNCEEAPEDYKKYLLNNWCEKSNK